MGCFQRYRGSLSLILTSIWMTATLACVTHRPHSRPSLQVQLSSLEAASGGRIGLSAVDMASGRRVQYRAHERFPLCSTFKAMAVAAILKKSAKDASFFQKHIGYSENDVKVAGYSPITERHLAKGMSVAELSAATLQYSDNAAANLLMKELGGPQAVTAFAQSLGDEGFRLDRWEPELNSAEPNDPRDTTTPAAMESSLQRILLGDGLPPSEQKQLEVWLKGNTTGDQRIRAGVPQGWVVGDKTGTGSYGTTHDVGIIWPPDRAPIVLAIYFSQNVREAKPRNDVIASITEMLMVELQAVDE